MIAWGSWAAAAATTPASMNAGVRALFFLPGTFAPGIVALWLTARTHGRTGVDALLGGLYKWDVGARWYVFAMTYMAAVRLTAAAGFRAITGAWPDFGPEALYLLPFAVAFSTPFQAGEEIGWRAYALPRMAARLGPGLAAVLLGIIWAAWHLPLFVIPGTGSTGQPFLPYLLSVTAISVAMAWLYGHTRGSLLLIMILHAAINNTLSLVSSAVPGATNPFALTSSLMPWLISAVAWGAAACFLVRMPAITELSVPATIVSTPRPS